MWREIDYGNLREIPLKGGEDDADQGTLQGLRPENGENKKTLLTHHLKDQFYEGNNSILRLA